MMSLLLCGCGNENVKNTDSKKENDNVKATITCEEMKDLVDTEDAILIDVRSKEEYKEGHLEGAINLDYSTIGEKIESKVKSKDTKIVVYCRSGNRSAQALQTLKDLGYESVYDLGAMSNCK